MMIHVWEEKGEWFWDDAEDHGGFDRNVPSGPFASRDEAIQDANEIFGDAEVVDGKPDRYEVEV
jgi:hypothetical protein